jgi:hypothetical protein
VKVKELLVDLSTALPVVYCRELCQSRLTKQFFSSPPGNYRQTERFRLHWRDHWPFYAAANLGSDLPCPGQYESGRTGRKPIWPGYFMNGLLQPWIWAFFRACSGFPSTGPVDELRSSRSGQSHFCDALFKYASDAKPCAGSVACPSARSRDGNS